MTISEKALLACPRCGSNAFLTLTNGVWCSSDRCLQLPPRVSETEAIAAWNTRATEKEVERIVGPKFKTLAEFTDALFAEEDQQKLDTLIGEAITLLHHFARLSTLRKAEPPSDAVRQAVLAEIDNLDDEPTLYAHYPEGPWKGTYQDDSRSS